MCKKSFGGDSRGGFKWYIGCWGAQTSAMTATVDDRIFEHPAPAAAASPAPDPSVPPALPASSPAPPTANPSADDDMAKIRKLKKMQEDGVITKEDFERKKKEILDRM